MFMNVHIRHSDSCMHFDAKRPHLVSTESLHNLMSVGSCLENRDVGSNNGYLKMIIHETFQISILFKWSFVEMFNTTFHRQYQILLNTGFPTASGFMVEFSNDLYYTAVVQLCMCVHVFVCQSHILTGEVVKLSSLTQTLPVWQKLVRQTRNTWKGETWQKSQS